MRALCPFLAGLWTSRRARKRPPLWGRAVMLEPEVQGMRSLLAGATLQRPADRDGTPLSLAASDPGVAANQSAPVAAEFLPIVSEPAETAALARDTASSSADSATAGADAAAKGRSGAELTEVVVSISMEIVSISTAHAALPVNGHKFCVHSRPGSADRAAPLCPNPARSADLATTCVQTPAVSEEMVTVSEEMVTISMEMDATSPGQTLLFGQRRPARARQLEGPAFRRAHQHVPTRWIDERMSTARAFAGRPSAR